MPEDAVGYENFRLLLFNDSRFAAFRSSCSFEGLHDASEHVDALHHEACRHENGPRQPCRLVIRHSFASCAP